MTLERLRPHTSWRYIEAAQVKRLAPTTDNLVNTLIGDTHLLSNRFQRFTGRVAGTHQTVALIKGQLCVGDRLCRAGNTVIKEVKHPPDSGVHGGYTGDVEARWGQHKFEAGNV